MKQTSKIIALLLLICCEAQAMEQDNAMQLDVALESLSISLGMLKEQLEDNQSTTPKPGLPSSNGLPTIKNDLLITFLTPLDNLYKSDLKAKNYTLQGLDEFRVVLEAKVQKYINANTQQLRAILTPSTPENIAQFTQILTRMITSGLFEKLTYKEEILMISGKEVIKPTALSTCHCVSFAKRVAFNITLLYDILNRFPNKTQPLVYTTMGSGGLLQDYLIIQALIWSGYTNLQLNLIDLYYPDAWRIQQLQSAQTLHANFIKKYMLMYIEQIELLRLKLLQDSSQVYAQKGTTVSLETHLFNNAYEYMDKAKQHPYERTNVLVMVDVEIQRPEIIENYPSLANAIRFTLKDLPNNKPYNHTFAFLPRNKPIQLYQLDLDRLNLDKSSKIIGMLKDAQQELIQLARTSGATSRYTGKFFLELDTLPNKYYTKDEVPNTEEYYAMFASDPFITFQDMLFDALAENALVYTLYKKDYGAPVDSSALEKIDIEAAKKINPVEIIEPALRSMDYKKVDLN